MALLCSSTILALVDPGAWLPKDLDIYTPYGFAQPIIRFLVQTGYRLDDVPYPYDYSRDASRMCTPELNTMAAHVESVQRLVSDTKARHVDVIESDDRNPIACVLDFHSTIVVGRCG